jgi:hypothetical protein
MNPFAPLLEKAVKQLFVNQDQSKLKFVFSWGGDPVVVATEGDCCSETWFADIVGVDKLLKDEKHSYPSMKEIIGVELLQFERGHNVDDGRSRQDVDEVYGVRLKTRQGDCDIIYRNSSNGYYCGDAVVGTEADTDEWTEIKEDWQA